MKQLTDDIQLKIKAAFPKLGRNKRQEVERLVFEIAKREHLSGREVVGPLLAEPPLTFVELKARLIKRRFPRAAESQEKPALRFPLLDLDPGLAVEREKPQRLQPRVLVVEQRIRETEMVRRLTARFPDIPVQYVDDHRRYLKRPFQVADYNERRATVFVVRQKGDFFLPCPCSEGSEPCGYWTFNLGYGCPYDCQYCFLQSYVNAPGLSIPANLEDFFSAYDQLGQDLRLGTGQFTDSLALDHLTGYASRLVEFFRVRPRSVFEFKTKSDQVEGVLAVPAAENVVVGWSLNPQKIIDEMEWSTASLEQRLSAAARCQQAGYRVAFHFDPVVVFDGWQDDYQRLVKRLFEAVDPQRTAWVSVGALRLTYGLKTVIENRFPVNTILDGELLEGYDGKLRYSRPRRREIYQLMEGWVKGLAPGVRFYLCMEEAGLYAACGLKPCRF